MSYHTNPTFQALRRALRATGLASPLAKLLGRGGGYEHRFNAVLEASIRPGDCVWDVGANVGYYTTRFASLCGEAGKVFAFEPSPINAARLREAVQAHANVTVFETALSDHDGAAEFSQGNDNLGATSRIVESKSTGAGATSVPLTAGDTLVARHAASVPNVLKIDVEGHEYEVLRGLNAQLRNPALRDVFMEVHFAQLDAAGRSDVPAKIVGLLEAAHFEVAWVDPSHLHANRRATAP